MSSFLNSISKRASDRFSVGNSVNPADNQDDQFITTTRIDDSASTSSTKDTKYDENRSSFLNRGSMGGFKNSFSGVISNAEKRMSSRFSTPSQQPSSSESQNHVQQPQIPSQSPSRASSSAGSTVFNTTGPTTTSNLTERTNISSTPSLSQTPLIKRSSVSNVNPHINNSFAPTQKPKITDPNLAREIENLRSSYRQQNFWKYHIIKLAPNEFYLTTNPDKRHRFIRNAPSYFVKLELPTDETHKENGKLSNAFKNHSQVDKGFRLVFTQQQVIGINGYDGCYKSFIIEKVPKNMGGSYKISCQYNEFQQDWNIQNNVNQSNINKTKNLNFQFMNSNSKISQRDNNSHGGDKEKERDREKDKEIYDAANNLMLIDDYTMGDFLHVCGIKDKKKSLFIKNKIDGIKLAKNNSVYFLDTGFFKKRKWFDPIISVFRPCNRDVKNKFTKSVLINSKSKFGMHNVSSNSKKLFSANKLNVDFSSMNLKNKEGDGNNNGNDNDGDDDDEYDYDNEEDDDDDEMSENVIDLENSNGVNYSKFYNAKDGLFSRHPKDDSPNDYKLGWITIYEKGRYFEKIPNGGNWQMVLGMTFAVGFEKLIDKYLKEEAEVV